MKKRQFQCTTFCVFVFLSLGSTAFGQASPRDMKNADVSNPETTSENSSPRDKPYDGKKESQLDKRDEQVRQGTSTPRTTNEQPQTNTETRTYIKVGGEIHTPSGDHERSHQVDLRTGETAKVTETCTGPKIGGDIPGTGTGGTVSVQICTEIIEKKVKGQTNHCELPPDNKKYKTPPTPY